MEGWLIRLLLISRLLWPVCARRSNTFELTDGDPDTVIPPSRKAESSDPNSKIEDSC